MEKLSQRSKLPQDELLSLIKKLPRKLDEAYHSFEMIDVLEGIAHRYKFNEDELLELSGIVYDVLLGFLKIKDIDRELAHRINLEGDKLAFVRGELDAFILNRLHNDINQAYGPKEDNATAKEKNSDEDKALPSSGYSNRGAPDPYLEPIE
jgi:hypothetical protein